MLTFTSNIQLLIVSTVLRIYPVKSKAMYKRNIPTLLTKLSQYVLRTIGLPCMSVGDVLYFFICLFFFVYF